MVKTGRQRWLGHLFRTQELDPCRQLTLFKPEGTRRGGKPGLRWLESVEEDLKKMGWRDEVETRVAGLTIVEGK